VDRKILVKHYAGSISYGTNIASSDTDFRGIFLGSRYEVCTPFDNVTEWVDPNEEDTKLFELNFFASLATGNNPNILETLYVDPQDIVISTPEYEHLRNNRDIFLSKKIAMTTSSYALQELIKMKSHNKYINKEEILKPKQTDFLELIRNFTEEKIMKNDLRFEERFSEGYKMTHYGSGIFGLIRSERSKPFNFEHNINRQKPEVGEQPLMILRFKEDAYEAEKVKFKSYTAWKENRKNTIRNLIEEKFGYDTKNAMHLVRLMRTGYECVTQGIYIVKRPDAKELLSIREGAWSYDRLKEYAVSMDEKIKNAITTSPLPDEVDIEKVKKLIIEVQDSSWHIKPLPTQKIKTKKIAP